MGEQVESWLWHIGNVKGMAWQHPETTLQGGPKEKGTWTSKRYK